MYRKKYIPFTCLIILAFLFGCQSQQASDREDGDLDDTFLEHSEENHRKTIEQTKTLAEELEEDGWSAQNVSNGDIPDCYNFQPRRGSVDNYLKVHVGSGTDVALKLMHLKSDKCIRFVFINSGSTYEINRIPEGKYYLKIAYGKDWYSKVENDQCIGKFSRQPLYEKGTDILDFNVQHQADGYSIPSYALSLDVVTTSPLNSFSSKGISEADFNE